MMDLRRDTDNVVAFCVLVGIVWSIVFIVIWVSYWERIGTALRGD